MTKKAAKPTPVDPDTIENENGLFPKQELFCHYYTMPGDFFGNATLAYAEAYGYKLDTLSQEFDHQDTEPDDSDDLYQEAKRIVLEDSQASISVLQRKLRIGYMRAAELIDTLEERGIIGPADGAKPRQVIGANEGLDLETYAALEDDIEEEHEPQGHGGALKRLRKSDSPYERAKNVCAVLAHRLLRNTKVQARCRTLRLAYAKDDVVDSERMKVILQDDDKKAKMSGITSFDKLKGRIVDKTQAVGGLAFGEADLAAVIATLPEERQDYFYGVIKELIEEAELLGRDS